MMETTDPEVEKDEVRVRVGSDMGGCVRDKPGVSTWGKLANHGSAIGVVESLAMTTFVWMDLTAQWRYVTCITI